LTVQLGGGGLKLNRLRGMGKEVALRVVIKGAYFHKLLMQAYEMPLKNSRSSSSCTRHNE